MKQAKGIVILGAGLLQGPLIEACLARGYYTIVADRNPKAGNAKKGAAFVEIEDNDPDSLAAALEPYRGRFGACTTLGTDMALFIGVVNEAFGLPGINRRQGEVMTHKGKMRAFLKEHGLAQPPWLCSASKEELTAWVEKNPAEAYVIKPVRNMGARGIMYLKGPQDLSFAFEYAAAFSREGEVIIEPYIKGHEFSIDTLTWEGVTYSTGFADRIIEIKDGRFFIETGHTMPSRYNDIVHREVVDQIGEVARALGAISEAPFFGPLKGDVRLSEMGEVVIGEVAARLSGGFMSTHTYPLASGCDLIGASLDTLEGKSPHILQSGAHRRYRGVVIERAIVGSEGKLTRFHNPFAPGEPPQAGLLEFFQNFQVGDLIPALQNNVGKLANAIVGAPDLKQAEALWKNISKGVEIQIEEAALDYSQIRKRAREKFSSSICKACRVCDGVDCASGVPGMGGAGFPGSMSGFRRSVEGLDKIEIAPPPAASPGEPPTHTAPPALEFSFLGRPYAAPLMIAPVTGAKTNLGGAITEYDYVIETGAAARSLGVAAMFGDGATPDKYLISLEAIAHFGGYLVVKPRSDQDEIIKRVRGAKEAGAFGWGIDIDAVGIATMEARGQKTSHKSSDQLREIAAAVDLPFFVKGISTTAGAELALSAGASAILVGNHGGRVDEKTPPAVETLAEIAAYVKTNYPAAAVIADGGIRSGAGLFKMAALGASGGALARPVAIAAVAYGRLGVSSLLRAYIAELKELMEERGLGHVGQIERSHILF